MGEQKAKNELTRKKIIKRGKEGLKKLGENSLPHFPPKPIKHPNVNSDSNQGCLVVFVIAFLIWMIASNYSL